MNYYHVVSYANPLRFGLIDIIFKSKLSIHIVNDRLVKGFHQEKHLYLDYLLICFGISGNLTTENSNSN